MEDKNDLAFWLPRIQAVGLPTPATTIIKSPDMTGLLDGETPEGWDKLVEQIHYAGDCVGWPCFLRTGHGSGKHDWNDTCYLENPLAIAPHVRALVEWSHMTDLMGLPTTTWAVREMLEVAPLFYCERYGMMPVVTEVRFFVRDGEVVHRQSYWPLDAVMEGRPVWTWQGKPLPIAAEDVRRRVAQSRRVEQYEIDTLEMYARRACKAMGGGYWSVDFLEDADGKWWLCDMALGDQSFRYDEEPIEVFEGDHRVLP